MRTTGDVFTDYKEQIRRAIKKSQIKDGEDENGNIIWAKVTKDEAVEKVLELYDATIYMFIQANASANALSDIIGAITKPKFDKYVQAVEKYRLEQFQNYRFEDEELIQGKPELKVIDGGKQGE